LKAEEYRVMYQAEDTLWWYQGMESITRSVLEGIYGRRSGLNILDAGCGTGAAMGYLADFGVVTGVDLSEHALHFSRERGRARLTRGSVVHLPFRSGTFDLVTSFDVLCSNGIDDEQALQEFNRVLVPEGRVILRLPACNWLRGAHDAAVDVHHRYSAGEINAKTARAGFAVDRISHANMWLFPLAVLKRWSEKFLPRQNGSDLTLNVGPLNGLFRRVLTSEARFVAGSGLPFGLTVVVVGRKPAFQGR
jgi:SAM-dependent methyltransferase